MARVTRRAGRWRSDEGAQLVEFALVLPLLLLVVLGIAEFGFVFQRYEVLTNAAREGARIAVLPGYSTVDVQARVSAYLTAGRVPIKGGNPDVQVTTVPVSTSPGAPPMNVKRVTVTYTYSYQFIKAIAEWFGAGYTTLPMTAVAEMRVEIAAGT